MDFDIREIREYYDSKLHHYNYDGLVNLGVSHENATFMIDLGVPEEYVDFVFYDFNNLEIVFIEDIQFIKIGYQLSNEYGLFLKEGNDEVFTSSSLHQPSMYILNRNLRTFFLFQLVRYEVAAKMRKDGIYTSYNYAIKLRKEYERIDPLAMKDNEGYWSHLIEDYETGL